MSLSAAKLTFQQDIQKALYDAFKATFSLGAGEMGDEIAMKFAEKGAPEITDAIYKFLLQASITGTLPGTIVGTCAVGPVTGTSTAISTGNQLTLN